jgi:hypothetical protein
MAGFGIYEPHYSNSWALVVGINNYHLAPPLGYARNDAEGFGELLIDKFGFPETNVIQLLDEEATKDRILSEYLDFTTEKIEPDDRVIVFFAGHGYTRSGKRGERGFLVPVDGNSADLSTLIGWDEFTKNSELIQAKHVLFIMDACYGGLAITRYLPPGSTRFVKDMLQRYTRQVLTAGKANETVSDSGGPRPGHSVFTGHLMDALDGSAATGDGILTANIVMAYVYDRVANDYMSAQTPHYGWLDGDGDLIFNPAEIPLDESPEKDKDILIEVSPMLAEPHVLTEVPSLADRVKEYLSSPQYRIKLDDLVTREIRHVLPRFRGDAFSVNTNETYEEFAARLKLYENALQDLMVMVTLLGRWAGEEQRNTLAKVFARTPDSTTESNGRVVWLGLRWYPVMLLMYVSGIAALAADNYENLAAVLTTRIGTRFSGEVTQPVILPTVEGILDVERADMFKKLPGYERYYVPRSEYLFKALQPVIDDTLFLGRSYEQLFDRFEVLYTLTYADLDYDEGPEVWGPLGRFAWKYSDSPNANPFVSITAEAERARENWAPLRAGLFKGSYERFSQIADGYRGFLNELHWG